MRRGGGGEGGGSEGKSRGGEEGGEGGVMRRRGGQIETRTKKLSELQQDEHQIKVSTSKRKFKFHLTFSHFVISWMFFYNIV